MNVCVIGWMKLVIKSALSVCLEKKKNKKYQFIYHKHKLSF